MKIIQGKRKCSIPGALTEGESTRIKYQALAEKDIKTGLAIEAMAAVLGGTQSLHTNSFD